MYALLILAIYEFIRPTTKLHNGLHDGLQAVVWSCLDACPPASHPSTSFLKSQSYRHNSVTANCISATCAASWLLPACSDLSVSSPRDLDCPQLVRCAPAGSCCCTPINRLKAPEFRLSAQLIFLCREVNNRCTKGTPPEDRLQQAIRSHQADRRRKPAGALAVQRKHLQTLCRVPA